MHYSKQAKYQAKALATISLALCVELSLAVGQPALATDAQGPSVVMLNNEGVRALSKSDYKLAIEKLEAAVKVDPGYRLARLNLAIACNNYGLQLRSTPKEALKLFYRAHALDPKNPRAVENIEGCMRLMGKSLDKFSDRVDLGDDAHSSGDLEAAAFQYSAALKIKEDEAVRLKLTQVNEERSKAGSIESDVDQFAREVTKLVQEKLAGKSIKSTRAGRIRFSIQPSGEVVAKGFTIYNSTGDTASDQAIIEAIKAAGPFKKSKSSFFLEAFLPEGGTLPVVRDYLSEPEPEYGPWMVSMQKRIKSKWEPPVGKETERVRVVFKVHSDGSVSDINIVQPSEATECNRAALTALQDASPLPTFPKEFPDEQTVEFTFDYNVKNARGAHANKAPEKP